MMEVISTRRYEARPPPANTHSSILVSNIFSSLSLNAFSFRYLYIYLSRFEFLTQHREVWFYQKDWEKTALRDSSWKYFILI